jgi:hypothetical protein
MGVCHPVNRPGEPLRVGTLAYWLRVAIGLVALRCSRAGIGSSRKKNCVVFFIGRKMLRRRERGVEQPLAILQGAIVAEAKKCG